MAENIQVTRSSMPPIEEYIEEIRPLWESCWLTNMGPKYREFQEKLCEYLGVEHIDLVTNGHMALELSIQALQLKGEIITTPFTFASTTHAIVRNGCTPVFCDINADDFTIDVSKMENLITDKTTAILPVHVYGNVCNIEEIDRIAKKYSLKVLYDAAHSFGEKYKGKGIGSFGDVSCFSFHATKVFNSIEGGAACFKNEEFGERFSKLKNFGIRDQECVDEIGANAKMNEFCAAMGLCNLRHIDGEITKRKRVAERYMERLSGVAGILLNPAKKYVQRNYAYFPVVFNEKQFGATRDEVSDALNNQGIYARKYFYPLTNTYSCYQGMFDMNLTPVAQQISKEVLTLPMYADLTLSNVDRICDIVLNCRLS